MTVKTVAQIKTDITTLLADNAGGDISASDVRSVFTDVVDTMEDMVSNVPGPNIPNFDASKSYSQNEVFLHNGVIYRAPGAVAAAAFSAASFEVIADTLPPPATATGGTTPQAGDGAEGDIMYDDTTLYVKTDSGWHSVTLT